MISVRNLFFNVPARRKFLKSIATEMAHITDLLAGLALAWPGVQFRLTHNNRVVKNWPAAADPFERALEVLGGSLRNELHPVALELEGVAVGGWVSRPQLHRRTADGVFTLVNRRHVRDRVVQHALFQGYAQRLVKGQYPLAVLFLTVPCGEVDVNVHPAKNEVRFARPGGVHEVIRRAVAQTLYDIDRPGFRQGTPETNRRGEQGEGCDAATGAAFGVGLRPGETSGEREGAGFGSASGLERRGGTPLPQEKPLGVGGASSPDGGGAAVPQDRGWKAAPTVKEETPPFGGEASGAEDRGGTPLPQEDTPRRLQPPASSLQHAPQSTHRAQVEIWEARGFAGLRVVGQLHNTYIVAEADDGLVLVDQHAAHERVLYDRLARPDAAATPAGQVLLVPETVELGAREAEALERLLPHLRRLGLEAEPFGGGTVVVRVGARVPRRPRGAAAARRDRRSRRGPGCAGAGRRRPRFLPPARRLPRRDPRAPGALARADGNAAAPAGRLRQPQPLPARPPHLAQVGDGHDRAVVSPHGIGRRVTTGGGCFGIQVFGVSCGGLGGEGFGVQGSAGHGPLHHCIGKKVCFLWERLSSRDVLWPRCLETIAAGKPLPQGENTN